MRVFLVTDTRVTCPTNLIVFEVLTLMVHIMKLLSNFCPLPYPPIPIA